MSRGNKYKSKSDYTLLRNVHQNVPGGTIMEHDHMTISKMDEYFSEQEPVYSDSNFKFSVRPGTNKSKRHTRYGWVCPTGVSQTEGKCGWTLENLPESPTQKESRPRPNVDYTTLRSFAYYGSAVDLINATINGVVTSFPGELYFTRSEIYIDTKKIDEEGGIIFDKYYSISNPFAIDIHTMDANKSDVDNELRYFCLNAYRYDIIREDGSIEHLCDYDVPWRSEIKHTTCKDESEENGVEIARVFLADGSIEISVRFSRDFGYMWLFKDEEMSGIHIRPNNDIVEEYFANIDEFTNVLLNRDTNPLYSCTLETVTFDNENGFLKTFNNYTWPTIGGYNPDINDENGFYTYMNDLIAVASHHDEYDSDNIWRVLTHESLKTLDWTFSSSTSDPINDLNPLNSTKIEAMCKLYGRQYDDLKMYIDSIKHANRVTYDKRNNVSDYCLSDLLSNNGWQVKSLDFLCDDIVRTDALYPSESNGKNSSEANIAFLNRLLLNTRYIYSLKGTRVGIDTIMAMFGFDADEYDIIEHVGVARPKDLSYIVLEAASKVSKYDKFVHCEFSRYAAGDITDSKFKTYLCWRKITDGADVYLYTKTGYSGSDGEETNAYYSVKDHESGNITLKVAGTASLHYDSELESDIPGMQCKYPSYEVVKKYNMLKNDYSDALRRVRVPNQLAGIYAGYVYLEDSLGNDLSYVIPWCDKEWHDGKCYFQADGGWWKENNRNISLDQFNSVHKLISAPGDEFGLYGETLPIVHFVSDLSELLEYGQEELREGDICYVTDISDIGEMYSSRDDEERARIVSNESTHYFILKNLRLNAILGYYEASDIDVINSGYGWKNVMGYEVDNNTLTMDGKKVIYAESIIKDTDGNNPHIGYGQYDEGRRYLLESANLFNWSLRNNNFTKLNEHEFGQADRLGFDITEVLDNRKVWYYKNSDDPSESGCAKNIFIFDGCDSMSENGNVLIGKSADSNYSDDYVGKSNISELFTYNPEAEQTTDEIFIDNEEPAANSIINLKTVDIIFKPKKYIEESNKFFKESIMPYLTAMIPSTTITRVHFGELNYAGMPSTETVIANPTCPVITVVEEEVDGTIKCVC